MSSEATQPMGVPYEILAAMRKTNKIASQAVSSGNMKLLEQVYTTSARILPPGSEMISGRPGIIEFWRAATGAGLKSAELTTMEALPTGDGIVEIGRAELIMGDSRVTVKYVVFWKHEDGAWKWHVDCWNMNA